MDVELPIILLITVGIALLLYLCRRPEIAFAVFLFSYVMEGGGELPIPFGLTGIMLFISIGGFFLPAVKGKPIRVSVKLSDFWVMALVTVIIGGSFLAPDEAAGAKRAVLVGASVAVPYLISRLFFKTYMEIRMFLVTIMVMAAGVGIVLAAMSLSTRYVGGRIGYLEANPIATGTLLAVALVIGIIGMTSDLLGKSRKSKCFCTAAVPLYLYGIVLSGVRGPLIAAVVGVMLYLALIFVRQPKAFLGLGVGMILLVTTWNVWHPYLNRKVPNIGVYYSVEFAMQGIPTEQRLEGYQAAITLFGQSPVFGVGTGGYAQRTGLGYPHNIFLEILADTGLIGFMLFVCFLSSIVWRAWQYLTVCWTGIDSQARATGLAILSVGLTLLAGRQFSFGLTMHKDLFAFLGVIVNLPLIHKSVSRQGHVEGVRDRYGLQKAL